VSDPFEGLTPQQIERKTLLMWVRRTAKDVLLMAATAKFCDEHWMKDERVIRAYTLLGVSPAVAMRWARWVAKKQSDERNFISLLARIAREQGNLTGDRADY
jgi:hypothetical protein